jgi:hypothetical protein
VVLLKGSKLCTKLCIRHFWQRRETKKPSVTRCYERLYEDRGEWIRTIDFLLPKQARCQAAPRPAGTIRAIVHRTLS